MDSTSTTSSQHSNSSDNINIVPYENDTSSLSDAQSISLALAPIIPSLLSILGSSTIIYLVYKDKKSTPYRRLLFAMSVSDIIFSTMFPLWSFLLPRDSSQHIWAIGNDTTCSISGATHQFSYSSLLYNAMLSYYFLFTVRFGWRDERFSKYVGPMMHIVSIGFPLITAIIGLVLGVYHESKLFPGCWVANYPENCGFGIGESGEKCKSPIVGWIFGGSIAVFLIMSLIANNLLIFLHVRQTIQRGRRRYAHGQQGVDDSQTKRIRAVATQAFLYVAACVIVCIFPMILRNIEIMESVDANNSDSDFYVLILACAICSPMQGIFNLLIFIRPKYISARSDFPNESKIWCFWRAIHGESIAPKHNNNNKNEYAAAQPRGIHKWQQQEQQRNKPIDKKLGDDSMAISCATTMQNNESHTETTIMEDSFVMPPEHHFGAEYANDCVGTRNVASSVTSPSSSAVSDNDADISGSTKKVKDIGMLQTIHSCGSKAIEDDDDERSMELLEIE